MKISPSVRAGRTAPAADRPLRDLAMAVGYVLLIIAIALLLR